MDSPEADVVGSDFAELARFVQEQGKPYPGGRWLRHKAASVRLVCSDCGPLPEEAHDGSNDWLVICQGAREHVRETGHQVAAELWCAAVYGPERP
jgi:hypothetical protein